MRDVGAECIGVDWRLPLGEAVKLIEHGPGDRFAVQGNIDPAILFASAQVRRDHVNQVLAEGKKAAAHIVNLGHGVPRTLTRRFYKKSSTRYMNRVKR